MFTIKASESFPTLKFPVLSSTERAEIQKGNSEVYFLSLHNIIRMEDEISRACSTHGREEKCI
jgi:hypothetical protein